MAVLSVRSPGGCGVANSMMCRYVFGAMPSMRVAFILIGADTSQCD